MSFYTFRKSDGVHLYLANSEGQQVGQWAACLANEGGVASDFVVKESDVIILSGQVATLENDAIVIQIDPSVTARLDAMATFKEKLIGLGLTSDQVDLVI